ncbi:sulfite reductase subunit C [Romboutsia sp.]|uniref:sulfite reductase subunit C n=1 Tax=Romboutsia sp. TaxID=1965302 RepID=UPI003F301169
MNKDINIDKLRANCFRQSKVAGEFMFQMRVPGGLTQAKHLSLVQHIAETYGNGTFHFGARQSFHMPGIKFENIDKVNLLVKNYIHEIEIEQCNVDIDVNDCGYPTLGARNIAGCIGADHCVKANAKVSKLASKIENIIFPSNYHIKTNIAGCPNDCIKAHMADFGILGVTIPNYNYDRCVGCGACARACQGHVTSALKEVNGKIIRNEELCIGCGECIVACPTRAFTRSPEPFYRVLIGGRTSKRSPRLGQIFLDYITEEVLLDVIGNWKDFSADTLNGIPKYLHGGHLMDMAGYPKFKELMLKNITLNEEARVATRLNWQEKEYKAHINVKKVSK